MQPQTGPACVLCSEVAHHTQPCNAGLFSWETAMSFETNMLAAQSKKTAAAKKPMHWIASKAVCSPLR